MLSNMDWVLLSLVVFTFPWILKIFIPHKVTLPEAMVASALSLIAAFIFFHTGKYIDSMDYEIYSGEITSKYRDHDSYQQSYDCNCNDGKCQTCYRTIYTVEWVARSNIGNFVIEKDESRSRSIYNRKDPSRYSRIYNGEPVSIEKRFINYVKGVPDSLFNETNFKGEYHYDVPSYPSVYDFYNINRVFFLGINNAISIKEWNNILSIYHKEWGYKHYANVILVFTDKPVGIVQDIRAKWIQGKQNDLIIIVGLEDHNKISWVEAVGWSENNDIKYSVSSDLMDLKEVNDPYVFMKVIDTNIKKGYKYRDMEKDFSHLKELIQPPVWVIVITYLFCLGISVLMMFIELEKEINKLLRK